MGSRLSREAGVCYKHAAPDASRVTGLTVSAKKWRFSVTVLGGPGARLAAGAVDAANWMGALRVARDQAGDPGGLPPGATCSVAADGVATILDGAGRRRYVLAPEGSDAAAEIAASPAPVAEQAAAPRTVSPAAPAPSVAARAQAAPGMGTTPQAPSPALSPAVHPVAQASAARTEVHRAPAALELLLDRDQDPTDDNPLRYRERAYVLPPGVTVSEAEALLRGELGELQETLADQPVGKLVNLAVFDHRWQGVPERPPLIVLQWRDWRDETTVEYPAERASMLPAPGATDERLADAFEGLQALSERTTAADGLGFAVNLLERLIPCEAISACLYDINTDELRFVALAGASAADMQGHAVPSTRGLLAVALRAEGRVSVFAPVAGEAAFDPGVDGRPFLEVRDLAYRPITDEGALLGALQLINHRGAGFSRPDAALLDYVARRLAEFLRETKLRARAGAAPVKSRR